MTLPTKPRANPSASTTSHTRWQTYRRLLMYILPYWKYLILVIIGFIINAGTEMGIAKLMQIMTDAITTNNQTYKNMLPFLVILLFFCRGLGSYLGNYFSAIVSRNVVYQLRLQTFSKLLQLPTQFFLNHSAGELSAKLIFDVEQVTAAGTDTLKTLLREGFTVIGLMAYLLYLNWRLTALLFIVLPPIFWLVGNASKKFRRLSKDIQDSMGEVNHISNEVIKGYQVVKNYGGQAIELARFDKASHNNLKKGLKIVVVNSINTPAIQLLLSFALAMVIWLAFRPNIMGNITAGEFVAYLVIAGSLNKPIKALTDVNQGLQKGLAAADSVFKLIDEPVEEDFGTKSAQLTGKIAFNHVDIVYQNDEITDKSLLNKAIDDFDLTINAGETIALVGRSGAGKTTIVNALMRSMPVTKGQILLDNIAIEDLTLASVRSQIASVNQQVILFNTTIANNIAYGELADKSREEIIQAAKSAYAHEFIMQLPQGYDTLIGSDGLQLSGGQRQRLSIARALLKNSPILILDEATSALDNESEFYIQKALETIMENRTTIVIAHRLTTIQNADKIVVMEYGKIVEVGSHDELMAKHGRYAKLYERNFEEDIIDSDS